MSRIGKKPVDFGADIKVSSNGDVLTFVKGKIVLILILVEMLTSL